MNWRTWKRRIWVNWNKGKVKGRKDKEKEGREWEEKVLKKEKNGKKTGKRIIWRNVKNRKS